jgi:hypothetical protein
MGPRLSDRGERLEDQPQTRMGQTAIGPRLSGRGDFYAFTNTSGRRSRNGSTASSHGHRYHGGNPAGTVERAAMEPRRTSRRDSRELDLVELVESRCNGDGAVGREANRRGKPTTGGCGSCNGATAVGPWILIAGDDRQLVGGKLQWSFGFPAPEILLLDPRGGDVGDTVIGATASQP